MIMYFAYLPPSFLLACGVPNTQMLTAGHIVTTTPISGDKISVGTDLALECESKWQFLDGSVTKVFSCIGHNTISPHWQNCSGKMLKTKRQILSGLLTYINNVTTWVTVYHLFKYRKFPKRAMWTHVISSIQCQPRR